MVGSTEKKSVMISNGAGAAAKKNKKIPLRVVRPSTKKRNGFLTKLVTYLKSDSDFLYSVDAVKGDECGDDLGSPVTGAAGSEKGMIERLREYLESDSFLFGPLIDDDRRRRCSVSVADRRRHTRRVTRDTLSPEMTSPVKQSALQREQSTGKNQGMKEYKNVDTLGKRVLHHRKVLKEVVHQRYTLSNPDYALHLMPVLNIVLLFISKFVFHMSAVPIWEYRGRDSGLTVEQACATYWMIYLMVRELCSCLVISVLSCEWLSSRCGWNSWLLPRPGFACACEHVAKWAYRTSRQIQERNDYSCLHGIWILHFFMGVAPQETLLLGLSKPLIMKR
ncbi:hypothetical protein AKJ16_DCAP20156 [Drosera capensis]